MSVQGIPAGHAAPLALDHILHSASGLQRVMGDRALYRHVLRGFRLHYQHSASQLRDALLAGDLDAIGRGAHTLKGAAGMIGAQQVQRLATALEGAAAGTPADCVAPLAALGLALEALMATLDLRLSPPATPPLEPADTALAAPLASAMLLTRLARLLDEGDGAAIDVLEHSAALLEDSLGEAAWAELSAAARQFDFEAALAILRAAQPTVTRPVSESESG